MPIPSEIRRSFVITGPTASGKTSLGHELALTRGLQIISADSMQVYRDLPIATAAPSAAQMNEVKYHLVGMLDSNEIYSASRFLAHACDVIHSPDVPEGAVLIVGGTGLYIRALKEGLFEMEEAPPEIREGLQRRIDEEGIEKLYEELKIVDPLAAASIHSNDAVRVRRALEVLQATGTPISTHWERDRQRRESGAPAHGVEVAKTIVLAPPREILYERINLRTRRMFEEGMLAEIASLVDRFELDEVDKALRPLGARELAHAMQEKSLSRNAAPSSTSLQPFIAAIAQTTRRYAKRQLTWLRKFSPPGDDILWLEPLHYENGELVNRTEEFLFS